MIVVLYTDGGEGSESVPPHILAFMEHYFSLTWMTYRAHFTPIPGTMLTTDCGWGCMVRSGQMMLATVLHYHLLSRGQLCMCTIPCTYMLQSFLATPQTGGSLPAGPLKRPSTNRYLRPIFHINLESQEILF